MKKALFLVMLGVAWFGVASAGAAEVLTFDDVSTTTTYEPIPSGYGGFQWSEHFNVIHRDYHPGSGYDLGTVSGMYTAFNASAYPVSMGVAPGSTFDFNGAYLTSAWYDQNVQVQGFLNGSLVADQSVWTVTTGPTWVDFNFLGIDTLTFTSLGGSQFAMDNFTYNGEHGPVVPVPGAIVLGTLGTGLVGWMRRRRAL
jgi:hypothetical protein